MGSLKSQNLAYGVLFFRRIKHNKLFLHLLQTFSSPFQEQIYPVFFLFPGLRFTYRTVWFPQIQEADMASFRTADAFIKGFITYRA